MDAISVGSTVAGLAIGSLVLCANFQFGLQTGWVSMMSMPAALLGFAWFKVVRTALSPQENVYLQSVAVAVGTGPLSFGFVGAIPAIEQLLGVEEGRISLSVVKLIFWSLSISFVGIFTAVLLREAIIKNRELTFPSGRAAAALIGVLHNKPLVPDAQDEDQQIDEFENSVNNGPGNVNSDENKRTYKDNIVALTAMFGISSIYTFLSRFAFPPIRNIPFLGPAAAQMMWTFEPSPAYIGQGIIMGLPTTGSMLLGAVLGWAILSPLCRSMGWATGPVDDWQTGSQGWIMWVSLAIMVADTGVNFIALTLNSTRGLLSDCHKGYEALMQHSSNNYGTSPPVSELELQDSYNSEQSVDPNLEQTLEQTLEQSLERSPGIEHPVSQFRLAIWGLTAAAIGCIAIVKILYPSMSVAALTLAVAISPVLSLLGVRALGETDLNPVSSIAKLTQLLFGLILRSRPDAVLLNIVAGAITEAGAQQAGDLMQDYKTGSLLGASMTNQTIGMVVGTCWSVVLSALIYTLYTSVYEIPGKEFRIPTAYIWVDCARLVTGGGLPAHVGSFALFFGGTFVLIALAKKRWANKPFSRWIPSGVAVGIGMYNVPSFTLARFVGGLAGYLFIKRYPGSNQQVYLVILSSGLILGEGVMSVLSLVISLAMHRK